MSEYQYYEFRAIDRPLDERELRTLHSLSTRAETRSCNTHRCAGRFRSALTIFLTFATVEERIAAVKSTSPSSRSRQSGHEAMCFLTRSISTSESSCKA